MTAPPAASAGASGPPEHPEGTPGTPQVPREGRVTLLLRSPRVAPGLLTWPAWERLRSASEVLAADPDPEWSDAFAEAGVRLTDVTDHPVGRRAGRLVETAASGREVAWWGSPDGDPGLTDALAEHLSRRAITGRPPEVEVLTASHDEPGSRLLDLVAVMDRLRSPGGCPWDAAQTHRSLLPYLLEETHEVIEAVEAEDRAHLMEELGDLLLQVVFHARLGQEDPHAPFGIDEVAAGIVTKLVRRHPHVFADGEATDPGEVEHVWEALKSAEKPGRLAFEGIPASLPALGRAQKMLARIERAGADPAAAAGVAAEGDALVISLLDAVRRALATGRDAESELRAALLRLPPPGPAAAR